MAHLPVTSEDGNQTSTDQTRRQAGRQAGRQADKGTRKLGRPGGSVG